MNHLSLTICPDPICTEICKHDPKDTEYGPTELVVFAMPMGVQRVDIMFDSPADAYNWLQRCEQLLDGATGRDVEDSVPA